MSKNCQKCNGKGYHYAMLKNFGTLEIEEQIVPCEAPACRKGKITEKSMQEYYDSFLLP